VKSAAAQSRTYRFAAFELDLTSGELLKEGRRLRLQEQPFQVLRLLLENHGSVVTRSELRQKLWPEDTFVDFDHGLNNAVNRLRELLSDSAEKPCYIETLPRRGYRFIAPLEENPLPPSAVEVEPSSTKPDRKMWMKAGLAVGIVLLLGVAGGTYRVISGRSAAARIKSLAVLPLENLTGDPSREYLAEGMTEELTTELAKISALRVISRTSAIQYEGTKKPLPVFAKELNVDAVVEGSVERSGDRVRVTAQLIDAANDRHLWAESYERDARDMLSLQSEVARAIATEIQIRLTPQERTQLATAHLLNPEAYELYLKAKTLGTLRTMGHIPELLKSLELYQQVIAKDPNFAPAYAAIAGIYADVSKFGQYNSPISFEEANAKMREASEKALQLDPLLAEAHASMGLVYSRELAWGEAEKAFRRAIQLNPNLSRTHQDFALWVLWPLGKLEEAVREMRSALELDPLSLPCRDSLAYFLISIGRGNEALDIIRSVLAVDRDDAMAKLLYGRALLQQGRLNEAITIFEEQPDWPFLGCAYAIAGRRSEAEKLAAQKVSGPRAEALIYAGLGDKDRVIEGLERMAAIKDPAVDIYPFYPQLALIRADPRLRELRRKRGLPWMP
jgi:TolB-like protein/DNA-binding winged helix-turn-helix (wHTH) protein/Tfp pilus assembly protein PilF